VENFQLKCDSLVSLAVSNEVLLHVWLLDLISPSVSWIVLFLSVRYVHLYFCKTFQCSTVM